MYRRKVLTVLSSGASLSIAGCLSDLEGVTGADTEEVKEEAETVEYEELYRNISEYEGEPVTYPDVTITDIVSSEDGSFEFILQLPAGGADGENSSDLNFSPPEYNYLYGLWEGDPFQEDDEVELWGTVNGTTTYQSLSGEQTVPEIEIVDMELL